VYEILE
jgi:hypothetical protein